MEEKIASKEIKMKGAESQQRLTYDELNQACADMSQQLQKQDVYIRQLREQMAQMNYILQSRRLEYLFRVVELSEKADSMWKFNPDFIASCINEIQESLTIPEEKQGDSKEN
jgi:hypothetical protein